MLAFALGLTAKSMLVTLPCVLFLLDYWPLRRYPGLAPRDADGGGSAPGFRFARSSWRRLLVEKIPLFVLSAASTAITIYAQQKGGESNPLSEMKVRIGNALISYVTYIGKTVWPVGLVLYYPFPREVRMEGMYLLRGDHGRAAAAGRHDRRAGGGAAAPVPGRRLVLVLWGRWSR